MNLNQMGSGIKRAKRRVSIPIRDLMNLNPDLPVA